MMLSHHIATASHFFIDKGFSRTALVERLQGLFHCTDLGFSPFDAEFYALFDGVFFKLAFRNFLRYALFSKCSLSNSCK